MMKQLLYELKKDSVPGKLCQNSGQSIDYANGTKSLSEIQYTIKHVINLPNTLATKSFLLNGLPDFRYGGLIDSNTAIYLLDLADVPKGIMIGSEDYLIVEHVRYQVQTATKFKDICYVLLVKQAANMPTRDTISKSLTSWLRFSQEATCVIE